MCRGVSWGDGPKQPLKEKISTPREARISPQQEAQVSLQNEEAAYIAELRQKLLRKAMGNVATVERLTDYERRLNPGFVGWFVRWFVGSFKKYYQTRA